MFVPIILGSDKTTVSVATGQNDYYPLYLSIGNVQNHMRRAHKNALVVIGFLPIPKGKNRLLSVCARTYVRISCQERRRHRRISSVQANADPRCNREHPPSHQAIYDHP